MTKQPHPPVYNALTTRVLVHLQLIPLLHKQDLHSLFTDLFTHLSSDDQEFCVSWSFAAIASVAADPQSALVFQVWNTLTTLGRACCLGYSLVALSRASRGHFSIPLALSEARQRLAAPSPIPSDPSVKKPSGKSLGAPQRCKALPPSDPELPVQADLQCTPEKAPRSRSPKSRR